MKLSYTSIVILLVSVLGSPTVQAQTPASDGPSAISSAASPVQSASSTAEAPRLIKLSGTLLDSQERPVAGPVKDPIESKPVTSAERIEKLLGIAERSELSTEDYVPYFGF